MSDGTDGSNLWGGDLPVDYLPVDDRGRRLKTDSRMIRVDLLENCLGYWEARVRYNSSQGMWSAFWLQPYGINNVGDPWENAGAFASHSHGFEVGVLEWFAELFELGKESFWGYISSGGSESKSVLNCLPPTPRSP